MTQENLLPLFDALEYIETSLFAYAPPPYIFQKDYLQALNFLKAYRGSQGTFNSYRREIERLLQWCSLVAYKPLSELRREDIENFIQFCQRPPSSWIGIKKAPRFLSENGTRIPNKEWRPFVVTVSKSAHAKGERPHLKDFDLSQGSLKEIFAILSTFFNYLLQEEHVFMNPVALIRQKSKFIRKYQTQQIVRRLTETQWNYVVATAHTMADLNPNLHERSLFIISALYGMYLRISELSSNSRWSPQMNHFTRDGDGNWWFMTVGKGNKQRQIAVSDAMLEALKRWRKHLGLPAFPSAGDQSPLLPKIKGKGPITSTTYLRDVVQECFNQAALDLEKNNLSEEAEALRDVTVHWLRHTGISDDVKIRPREHVRDDAGHSSSATTDKYIDIELKERHRSAKDKGI